MVKKVQFAIVRKTVEGASLVEGLIRHALWSRSPLARVTQYDNVTIVVSLYSCLSGYVSIKRGSRQTPTELPKGLQVK
jgi:hypothetical protein